MPIKYYRLFTIVLSLALTNCISLSAKLMKWNGQPIDQFLIMSGEPDSKIPLITKDAEPLKVDDPNAHLTGINDPHAELLLEKDLVSYNWKKSFNNNLKHNAYLLNSENSSGGTSHYWSTPFTLQECQISIIANKENIIKAWSYKGCIEFPNLFTNQHLPIKDL